MWFYKCAPEISGAHFSVKLILAINGNSGVFGVATLQTPRLRILPTDTLNQVTLNQDLSVY